MILKPRVPLCFFTFLSLSLLMGCAKGAPPAPVAPPFSIAGVSYETAAPLKSDVKPLFNEMTPPPVRNYTVSYIGASGETVSAILVLPANTKKPLPCILIVHGLGGSKAQVLPITIALANRGFASLAIDAAGHGTRKLPGGKAFADWGLPEIRQICAQTTVDLRRAVDYLQTRPDIDSARIGYAGVSLGGIIGSLFVPNEPRIKAAVLLAAGGDWARIVKESEVGLAKRRRAEQNTPIEKIAEDMRDVDPMTYIAKAAPRPLLFINGDKDTIVPTVCGKRLFEAAKDVKKQMILPGGHIPDITVMVQQTVLWLEKYVKGDAAEAITTSTR